MKLLNFLKSLFSNEIKIGDTVEWETGFGRYKGKVIDMTENSLHVEFSLPKHPATCSDGWFNRSMWKKCK